MTWLKLVQLSLLLISLGPAVRVDQALSPSATPSSSPTPSPTATPAPSPEGGIDVAATLALADQHFAHRSVGAIELVAKPQEVDAAIELYRKALGADPRNIAVLAKLMRALHYRGAYTGLEG